MNDEPDTPEVALREKLNAIYAVAAYRPKFAGGIIVLSIFAALLEGIGLSFLIPVVEIAQGNTRPEEVGGIGQIFVTGFELVGLPFTLEWVVVSVGVVMIARYSASFLVAWLRAALRTDYTRYLQIEGYRNSLDARIAYYDEHGSDEILNSIVTESEYAASTIQNSVRVVEQGFLSLMYLSIAVIIGPWLTLITGIVLGGGLYGLRLVVESGYSVGDRVAEANERIQETVQAGTQGIREAKFFGLTEELFDEFIESVDLFTESQIRLRRNQALHENSYQMIAAITVFGLIYVALTFSALSLASLGVFLFAMFRLAPRISTLNNAIYRLEGDLPHLIRTRKFVNELQDYEEVNSGTSSPPNPVEDITFEDVDFSYDDERVLTSISFEVARGEFVAFVGPSGAGKSTIASLIARLYNPDSGLITANGTSIDEFVLQEWREKISIVQQDPYIFNETLRYNITVGNRDATEDEIHEVCKISEVEEFIDVLPKGLDTVLGDDGVRLSGGQRQRVALARALLKDADFLILDEATSDLDSHIEEQVHMAIENMQQDYGMLVIAHRLSTVVNADRIYTMYDGSIKETGTHEKLIQQKGTYADLYATQTQRG